MNMRRAGKRIQDAWNLVHLGHHGAVLKFRDDGKSPAKMLDSVIDAQHHATLALEEINHFIKGWNDYWAKNRPKGARLNPKFVNRTNRNGGL